MQSVLQGKLKLFLSTLLDSTQKKVRLTKLKRKGGKIEKKSKLPQHSLVAKEELYSYYREENRLVFLFQFVVFPSCFSPSFSILYVNVKFSHSPDSPKSI